MKANKKEFIANLDSVLEILMQYRDKLKSKRSPADKYFVRNFDDIIRNYQIIREEIPDELISRFGMPIQVMALQLIEQLRKELEEASPNLKYLEKIRLIDEQLMACSLNNAATDDLLDQRLKLMKEIEPNG
jgi:uncharacterized protein YcgL (UPF0745 family)